MIDQHSWVAYGFLHGVTGTVTVASILGYLPPIAAGAALVCYLMQIWSFAPVQRWRLRRLQKRWARIQDKIKHLENDMRG